MKLTDLQNLDQNIIKFLSEHRGIERAVKGRILAQTLNIDFRTLQGRIEYLHKQGCAIGSIDNESMKMSAELESSRNNGQVLLLIMQSMAIHLLNLIGLTEF